MRRRSKASNSETSSANENAQTFERNTRQRISPGSEESDPPSTLGDEADFEFTPMSPTFPRELIPETERGNLGQHPITSEIVARNTGYQSGGIGFPPRFHGYNVSGGPGGSQNGFSGGFGPSPFPFSGFPPRHYNHPPTGFPGFGSGPSEGQIGHHLPHSGAPVPMRGMVESRFGHTRAPQAPPRLRNFSSAGRTVVPPILPPSHPSVATQQRAGLSQAHNAAGVYHIDDTILQLLYNLIAQGVIVISEEEEDELEDMRLDVDDMSYEELLALGEQIGNVNTGLSEEAIMRGMRVHRYQSTNIGPSEQVVCCICREDYVDGENIGKVDCGHNFHVHCIERWLKEKNSCPICKLTALAV